MGPNPVDWSAETDGPLQISGPVESGSGMGLCAPIADSHVVESESQLLNLSTDVLFLTMLALLMWAIMTPHPDQWS